MEANDAPVALVTGARKGIGRHLAEHLVRQGYRVAGCGRGELGNPVEGMAYHQVDVTDEKQVIELLREVARSFRRLDVLVNNAGAASMNHALLTPGSTMEKLLDTNVLGTFLVSREAAKIMRRRKFGRIVNLSSIAVPVSLQGQAAYVASKGAVEHLSSVLARELAEFGITVNVVGPSLTDTDMTRGVPGEKVNRLLQSMPISRPGTFEDVANVIDFFLKPESSAVTGQVLYLGGVPNR